MFTRILVPLDGSAVAEKVLPHARALARNLQVPVSILTVVETATDWSKKIAAYIDPLVEGGVRNSEEYLKQISQTFSGVAVQYRVEKGRAEDAIIIDAAADRGTLITMAAHGRSGFGRWLLGSTSEKVVRGADNPVLVVRASEQTSSAGEAAFDSIIVPLDGSAIAEAVLPYAVELAKAFHARITVVRAYSLKHTLLSFEEFHPDLDELKREAGWEAVSYLEEKVAELKERGLPDVSCSADEGDPAEIIIEMGKRAPNALVAMTAHTAATIKHWMLGSVTEKVLRHASNSVLTVRT